MQHERVKLSEISGYNSSYDYTIYDIGFVFAGEDEETEDNTEESFTYVYHNSVNSGGNFH
jgi:hypothetical protein